MGNKEDTKAPCVHYGNSSTIGNNIDIITTALNRVTEFTNFRDVFQVKFENVVIPSTEVQCQRQLLALLCTVNIVSASMKIVVGYPHRPLLFCRAQANVSFFKIILFKCVYGRRMTRALRNTPSMFNK